ncbi:unnamed protein product [Phytophthora fragariaefolia]|uniref:Unnamed protein product n=1 Tax=Phytophthora fragariaefolia TaxID=1490495 RepID=A0A9W6Y761_9STRA|nr:unnamed protein product [Phytophthora fragariaefolia]
MLAVRLNATLASPTTRSAKKDVDEMLTPSTWVVDKAAQELELVLKSDTLLPSTSVPDESSSSRLLTVRRMNLPFVQSPVGQTSILAPASSKLAEVMICFPLPDPEPWSWNLKSFLPADTPVT